MQRRKLFNWVKCFSWFKQRSGLRIDHWNHSLDSTIYFDKSSIGGLEGNIFMRGLWKYKKDKVDFQYQDRHF